MHSSPIIDYFISTLEQSEVLFFLREGISQADVLAHLFEAAREREKLAKHVSTGCVL